MNYLTSYGYLVEGKGKAPSFPFYNGQVRTQELFTPKIASNNTYIHIFRPFEKQKYRQL